MNIPLNWPMCVGGVVEDYCRRTAIWRPCMFRGLRQRRLTDVHSFTVTALLCNSNHEWVNEYATSWRKRKLLVPGDRICSSIRAKGTHFFQSSRSAFHLPSLAVWARALKLFLFPIATLCLRWTFDMEMAHCIMSRRERLACLGKGKTFWRCVSSHSPLV